MLNGKIFSLPPLAIFGSVALVMLGCVSRTTKEVQTTTPPVVQINPTVAPAQNSQTTSAMPPAAGSQTTTTTWDNGAVVQKHTVTEPAPGVLQKQTTTTWNANANPPAQTTTTTTTYP